MLKKLRLGLALIFAIISGIVLSPMPDDVMQIVAEMEGGSRQTANTGG
jgi:hypothetical protein